MHRFIRGYVFANLGKNIPPVFVFSDELLKTCVAAIGVMCFSGIRFGGCPFCVEEAAAMEKNYFLDTLFDVINESDALEADLQDIQAEHDGLIVRIKDGTVFRLTITDE